MKIKREGTINFEAIYFHCRVCGCEFSPTSFEDIIHIEHDGGHAATVEAACPKCQAICECWLPVTSLRGEKDWYGRVESRRF